MSKNRYPETPRAVHIVKRSNYAFPRPWMKSASFSNRTLPTTQYHRKASPCLYGRVAVD